MSIGHTAFGSFAVLPSPDVLWKPSRSTKGPLGPNSPALLENLAQPVAKNVVLFKISLSKRPAVSPGRHFPFPVNGKLTNVCTDYSRMDAKAALPRQRERLSFHIISQKAEAKTWQRSLCNALLRKETQLLWELAFGSKYRM